MKSNKGFHSENRRFHFFRISYSILFFILMIFLIHLQFFEKEKFEDKERIQGQRRILRPGARGDVFDRNGKILIANKAQFSAVIHLDALKSEIWEKKVSLKKLAFKIREELSKPNLSISKLIKHCFKVPHIQSRSIILSGKKIYKEQRTKLFLGNKRLTVKENDNGTWSSEIIYGEITNFNFRSENNDGKIKVNVAGLFETNFFVHDNDQYFANASDSLINNDSESSIVNFFNLDKANNFKKPFFKTSLFSLNWEARYAVVLKYLNKVNLLLGKNQQLKLVNLKLHWNKRLVLPMELLSNLNPKEYALLIEGLSPHSPIQVQSSSIRHYPQKSLASHVLGYVGSGYEANAEGLSGKDLSTFEIKGKKGKAGIEKFFDDQLRGKDGGDIWRINPIGLRFDQVEKTLSEKGKSIQLSIDIDLQQTAESSLHRMSERVSAHRILPDSNWKKTIEKRTLKELINTNENELRPELLLSAFKDAPFPLNGKEASTVAGFNGTEKDANDLLRLLYSKGVLEKDISSNLRYFIAPPPPPPGAAVLLDVKTGEILALASIPNYNLSDLSPRISQSTYDRIERQEAWLPRAWHPGYAPASPFKLVTAVAALKANVVKPNEKFTCDGIYKGMICHCYPGRHGEIDLRKAEAQSCNVYFFQVAERLGPQKLIAEAKSFGMNITPKIELPRLRNSPNVPDPEWKKKNVGENWALEDTFNMAIGQGGLRQSPLQMACFAAALANKQKTFTPSLIRSNFSTPSVEPIGLTDDDYNAIIDGMLEATVRGTAKRCKIDGIAIAGKTGTAQWRNHNMKLSLAWFIGFAPVKNPQVAIAVLVEGVIPQDHIQGGLTATPVARDILQAYFNKQQQDSTEFN